MTKWICLILGSIAGGAARYAIGVALHERLGVHFPYGTLTVNLSGCLLIGILNGLSDSQAWVGPHERMLLITGFCGAYTTFSSLILETSSLMRKGDLTFAGLNLGLSLVGGLVLFRIGSFLAKIL